MSSRGKLYEKKNLGHKFEPKGTKSGLKLGFFVIFSILIH